MFKCPSGRVAVCRCGCRHSLTHPPPRGNLPRHIPRRCISYAFISARRFIAYNIRYANRAKKIVTKALEVRIEKPPPTMHEALRDIRELKARHYTLHLRMMTCVYVHDSLRCMHARHHPCRHVRRRRCRRRALVNSSPRPPNRRESPSLVGRSSQPASRQRVRFASAAAIDQWL